MRYQEWTSLSPFDRICADLAVSPAELSNIQEGQVITLFAGASGERAKAKVIFVSLLLDKDTRTARVVALLPNPTHQWRPGSFATAEFHSRRSRPASSSPSSPSSGATPVRQRRGGRGDRAGAPDRQRQREWP